MPENVISEAVEGIACITNLYALNVALLALNVAVGTSYWADSHMDFVVVADKVFDLAQRVSQMACDTLHLKEMSDQNQNNSEIGVILDTSIKEINAIAKDIDTLITEIGTITNKKPQGMEPVNTNVSHRLH